MLRKASARYGFLTLVLVIPGCSYKVDTPIAPSYDVYSSYTDKVPGRWAVLVDGEQLKGDFKVSGYTCSAHSYPLDASLAFNTSVNKTLENVLENVEDVRSPLSRDQLVMGGYSGLIRVKGEEIDVDLDVVPGFWTAGMKAEVQMVAALAVDGQDGRLLGGRIASDADDDAEASGACSGGADAISKATEKALRRLMEDLGEKVSNEPRLRQLNVARTPQPYVQPVLPAVAVPSTGGSDPYAIDP